MTVFVALLCFFPSTRCPSVSCPARRREQLGCLAVSVFEAISEPVTSFGCMPRWISHWRRVGRSPRARWRGRKVFSIIYRTTPVFRCVSYVDHTCSCPPQSNHSCITSSWQRWLWRRSQRLCVRRERLPQVSRFGGLSGVHTPHPRHYSVADGDVSSALVPQGPKSWRSTH